MMAAVPFVGTAAFFLSFLRADKGAASVKIILHTALALGFALTTGAITVACGGGGGGDACIDLTILEADGSLDACLDKQDECCRCRCVNNHPGSTAKYDSEASPSNCNCEPPPPSEPVPCVGSELKAAELCLATPECSSAVYTSSKRETHGDCLATPLD